MKYLDQVTRPKWLDSRPLPALIGLAFAGFTDALMDHVHAHGHADLKLHHLLNVFRFLPPEGERPARLARLAGVTPQAMSLTLGELVAAGYLVRERDPEDQRAGIVRWGERGLDAGRVVEEWYADLEHGWAAELGADRLEVAKSVLASIVEKGM